MNEFHERLYSKESREIFSKNNPNIDQLATWVFEEMRRKFSKSQYIGGRNLSIGSIPTETFEAHASVRKDDSNEHSIQISYGVPIDIRKDAILLPEICVRHFVEDKYSELFKILDFGNGPKCVLPPDLDPAVAKEKFFRISLAWLYLHEQSHLFQGHGSIFAEETGLQGVSGQFLWEDVMFSHEKQNQLTGNAAWISHCFELAADYEATNLVVQLLVIDDKQTLKKSSLWLLICGLTCIFHRFYGDKRPAHGGVATGTHPDPAIRMRAMYTAIVGTLMHSKVVKYVPWAKTAEDLQAVMEHAYTVANMYMQIAHFDNPEFPEFMRRMADTDQSVESYFSEIENKWCELRPKVMSRYFGFGEGSVRPAQCSED